MLYVTTFAITCFAGTDRKGTCSARSGLLKERVKASKKAYNGREAGGHAERGQF